MEKICPTCKLHYDEEFVFCSVDTTPLVLVPEREEPSQDSLSDHSHCQHCKSHPESRSEPPPEEVPQKVVLMGGHLTNRTVCNCCTECTWVVEALGKIIVRQPAEPPTFVSTPEISGSDEKDKEAWKPKRFF